MSCYPIQRCAAVRPKRSLSLFVWLVSLDGCSEQRWSVIAAELELCSESSLRRATTSFVAISAEQNTCRLRSCCMATSNVMLRLDHARIPAFCFFGHMGLNRSYRTHSRADRCQRSADRSPACARQRAAPLSRKVSRYVATFACGMLAPSFRAHMDEILAWGIMESGTGSGGRFCKRAQKPLRHPWVYNSR